jgi:hypothetical protein
MKTKLPILALLFGIFAFAQSPGDLIVTEIMFDPKSSSEQDIEWFEVYNTTNADIEMNGWTIGDNSSSSRDHVITSTTPVIVPANSYAVLVYNGDVAVNAGITNAIYSYGAGTGNSSSGFPTWNNESTYSGTPPNSTTADGPELFAPDGTLIDEIEYGFGYSALNTWPAQGAEEAVSYQLNANALDSASNDAAANWAASTNLYGVFNGNDYFGTPGDANFGFSSGVLAPNDIVITELMIDPDGTEDDTEYFEVYNTTTTDIDMQNWMIKDISSSSRAHTIATSVIVPANNYAVFALRADAALNQGITNVDYEYGFESPASGNANMDQYPRFNNESSFDDSDSSDNEVDGITITSPTGIDIDSVAYDYGYGTAPIGWPAQGLDDGASYESNTFDALSNDLAAAWNRATAVYGTENQLGTPGFSNTLSLDSPRLGTVTLYPNPATNTISISMENGSWSSISIFNVVGQQVLKVAGFRDTIDVSSLESGTYFVRVTADQGTDTIQFLVK